MEDIANWVAPVATTIAALMTASNLGSRITGYGFVVFTVGSIAWLILGIATDQPNLLWQNVVLTLLNIFGIWRWLGRQARVEKGAEAAQEASAKTPGPTLFPASLLTRAALVGPDNRTIARSIDAMLDGGAGEPAYLVASVGGVGGVGETLVQIPWRRVRIEGQGLRTDLTSDELLGRCKVVDRDEWPAR